MSLVKLDTSWRRGSPLPALLSPSAPDLVRFLADGQRARRHAGKTGREASGPLSARYVLLSSCDLLLFDIFEGVYGDEYRPEIPRRPTAQRLVVGSVVLHGEGWFWTGDNVTSGDQWPSGRWDWRMLMISSSVVSNLMRASCVAQRGRWMRGIEWSWGAPGVNMLTGERVPPAGATR